MKHAPVALGSAVRLFVAFATIFGASLLASRAPGSGVGLEAGLIVGFAVVLHVLAFGVAATCKAVPPPLAWAGLCLGVVGVLVAAAAPTSLLALRFGEGALFVATVAAVSLVAIVIAGRAPTLRSAEW